MNKEYIQIARMKKIKRNKSYVSSGSNVFYGTLTGNAPGIFVTSPYDWATGFTPKTN